MDTAALKNQVLGLSRGGIWFAAGWTVGYGMFTGETAVAIAGAIIGIIGGGWTTLANSNTSIGQAVAQNPNVTRIDTTDPKLAKAMQEADPTLTVVVKKENQT